jgi:hypothetical protein
VTDPDTSDEAGDEDTASPFVLVMGMHRSGTSAVTGLLADFGLALPPAGDLITGRPDNPAHLESTALMAFNDSLLEALGGSWNAPPRLVGGWESVSPAVRSDPEARSTVARVFGGDGPNLWKDPRNCLLLPYWRRLLTGPLAAVFIWRSPLAVARSLEKRDGVNPVVGLALWDRYTRSALAGMAGLPTFVVRYEALLGEPHATAEALAGWLSASGTAEPGPAGWDLGRAASVIEPRLSNFSEGADERIPDDQGELVARLASLDGAHPILEAADRGVGPASSTTEGILELQRQLVSAVTGLGIMSGRHRQLWTEHQELTYSFGALTDISDERLVHIRHLEDVVKEFAGANDALRERTAAVDRENAGLRHERDEWHRRGDAVAAELDRLIHSRSWRMTAPLRSVTGGRHRPEEADAGAAVPPSDPQ